MNRLLPASMEQAMTMLRDHAFNEERLLRINGAVPLSEQDRTHGEMVAKAQYHLTMTQTVDEVAQWLHLAYAAMSFAAKVAADEETQVHTGEAHA